MNNRNLILKHSYTGHLYNLKNNLDKNNIKYIIFDCSLLNTIPNKLEDNITIILDDFHRLPHNLYDKLYNYINTSINPIIVLTDIDNIQTNMISTHLEKMDFNIVNSY